MTHPNFRIIMTVDIAACCDQAAALRHARLTPLAICLWTAHALELGADDLRDPNARGLGIGGQAAAVALCVGLTSASDDDIADTFNLVIPCGLSRTARIEQLARLGLWFIRRDDAIDIDAIADWMLWAAQSGRVA